MVTENCILSECDLGNRMQLLDTSVLYISYNHLYLYVYGCVYFQLCLVIATMDSVHLYQVDRVHGSLKHVSKLVLSNLNQFEWISFGMF